MNMNETEGICMKDFDIGLAIKHMKFGRKVAREGWNGKGMYIYYVPANNYKAQTEIAKKEFGDWVPYHSYIAMKTTGRMVVPWLASQTDLIETDWYVVD